MDVEASVVIPVYNGEEVLTKSVESALAQKGLRFEVVLVNDGSTDGSLEVMHDLARRDPRVRVIHYDQNHGEPHARNVGIEEARGEWIATLDADDWIAPDRLSLLIRAAKVHKADMVADDMFLLGGNTGPLMTKRLLRGKYRGKLTLADKELFLRESLPRILSWSWGFSQPIYRRDVLLEKGVRYDESLLYSADWDFTCHCMLRGMSFLMVGVPFYFYEPNRPGSLTDTKRGPGIFNMMLGSTENMISIARQSDLKEALKLLLIRKYRLNRLYDSLRISYLIRNGRFGEALRLLIINPCKLPRFIVQSANGLWVRFLFWLKTLLAR